MLELSPLYPFSNRLSINNSMISTGSKTSKIIIGVNKGVTTAEDDEMKVNNEEVVTKIVGEEDEEEVVEIEKVTRGEEATTINREAINQINGNSVLRVPLRSPR